ncbi:T9SS type A sorting domain-containing protein [Sanyastnella coralliicola]|uniref:T9SS type A sorting domain-containing protein n=1 Tax=Sanyastnella coralliicola TaxID=3069118 RepID=UPI0027BAD3FE|nr:T9SS type A sorting domain-containing protein [Longitalea sp. SCSIO 12813]
MKRIIPFALSLLAACGLMAQEDPGTAVAITLSDFMQNTYDGLACSTAGSLGASGSGEAVCSGTDDDDVWYAFTATTQAIKITGTTSNFDMVIEVLDNGLNSVACQNTNGANSGETLYANTLIAGNDYYLRIHSANGAGAGSFNICTEYLPASEVRAGWFPTFTPDVGLPGYRINQTINRITYTPYNSLVEGSRWLFIDVDSGDQFLAEVNGSNGIINLNAVGGLCFDRTYDVYVQVQVDGYWCGYNQVRQIYTEASPTTELEPGYAGLNYDMTENVKARYVGDGQNIEWRLTTDGGSTVLTHIGASSTSFCYFDLIECIRYNKIYVIEARAEYCGVWGPWSDPEFIIINPLPYVNVRPEYCNTTQYPGATLQCEFLEVVDQYAWQIAPIEENDPTMTPIGPAIVTYSVNTTSLYLLPLGIPDGFYRVGVKPMLGTQDACDDPQEGDYGFFCQIEIGDPSGIAPDYEEMSPIQLDFFSNSLSVYPNPIDEGIATLAVGGLNLEGSGTIDIYDLSGRVVFTQPVVMLEQASALQFDVPSDLQPGTYSIILHGRDFKHTTRLVVK